MIGLKGGRRTLRPSVLADIEISARTAPPNCEQNAVLQAKKIPQRPPSSLPGPLGFEDVAPKLAATDSRRREIYSVKPRSCATRLFPAITVSAITEAASAAHGHDRMCADRCISRSACCPDRANFNVRDLLPYPCLNALRQSGAWSKKICRAG